jgi:hypothetical protein
MPVTMYVVRVYVRDPHDPQARQDSGGSYTERIYAHDAAEAHRLAKSRHVGGRVEARHIHTKIVATQKGP